MRPAEPPNFPEPQTPFVRLSASLVQGALLFTAKSLRSVLARSSNRVPSG